MTIKGLIQYLQSLHLNVKILLITACLVNASSGIAYPFLSEYIFSITNSALIAGYVASIKGIVCVMALILGGFLADNLGRKTLVWLGTLIFGLSLIFYSVASDFLSLSLAAICEGISYFYFPAFNAVFMDVLPSFLLVKTFALLTIIEFVPYDFFSLIGGIVRDQYGIYGLRAGFFVGGLVAVLISIPRWKLLTETLLERRRVGLKEAGRAYIFLFRDFLKLSSAVKTLIVLRATLLISGTVMFYYFAVLYVVRYAEIATFTQWGLILALSTLSTFLSPLVIEATKKYRPAILYSISTFLAGLTPLLFLTNRFLVLIASMMLFNLAVAVIISVENALIARTTVQNMRGRAGGMLNISFYLGSAIGSYLGGFLYSVHPPLILTTSFVMLLCCSTLSFMLLRKF